MGGSGGSVAAVAAAFASAGVDLAVALVAVVVDDDDGGVEVEVVLYLMVVDDANSSDGRFARRRGSVLGRNLKGVWNTVGADDGGLKMIWFCPVEGPVGVRKDGCGGMLSARFIRDAVAF